MLRLQFFGEFRANWNDPPLHFRSDKVRALFAYLVLNAGKPQPRRTLATLLWSNHSDTKSNANLRLTLTRLRETLQPVHQYLVITRETAAFTLPPDIWLDVSAFADAFNNAFAHAHIRLSNCSSCIAKLQTALTYCHGSLLETLMLNDSPAFEDWLAPQRTLWLERMTTAHNAIAAHALTQRQFTEAEHAARRAIALAPWREDGWRHLMAALHGQGQTAAALGLTKTEGYPHTAALKTLATQLQAGATLTQLGFAPPYTLPTPLTSFIGRTDEAAQVLSLFREAGQRLVTLWGEGGVGKTRLALAVAAQLKNDFPDGVWFLGLTTGMGRLAVLNALATLFGLTLDQNSDALGQVQVQLHSRHALVMIDNCEGVSALSEVAAALLPHAPHLHLLLVSRERLPLQAAANIRVQGLPYPGDHTGTVEYPAAQLFIERAQQAAPDKLHAFDSTALLEICRCVGGLPLALELAATWTEGWSLADIAAYLSHAQLDLNAQLADLPARHRDLRAVFTQSWQLLKVEEAQWLRSLAPLQEAFTLLEAKMLIQTDESDVAVMTRLTSLANRALLLTPSAGQYGWHLLMRQFALEQLQQYPAESRRVWWAAAELYSGRGDEAMQQFATIDAWQHYAEALVCLAQLHALPDAQRKWLDVFFKQLTIGFTLENAVEQKTRLMQALAVAQWLNTGEKLLPSDRARLAEIWLWLGRVHFTLGELGETRAFLERARTQPDAQPMVVSQATSTLGALLSIQGHYGEAVPLLQQALLTLDAEQQPYEWVMVAGGLGTALVLQGELSAAESGLLQMQTFAEAQHYEAGVAYAHLGLGMAAFWHNYLERALTEFRITHQLATQARNWTVATSGIMYEAWVLSRSEQHAQAGVCLAHYDELAKIYAVQAGALWRMAIGAEVALNAAQFSDALGQAQATVALAEQCDNLFIAGLGHRIWAQALPDTSKEIGLHLEASLAAFEQGGAQIEAAQSRSLLDNS